MNITFDMSKNVDVAAQEVRDKVDPVIRDLPETAEAPIVQKLDPDAVADPDVRGQRADAGRSR